MTVLKLVLNVSRYEKNLDYTMVPFYDLYVNKYEKYNDLYELNLHLEY